MIRMHFLLELNRLTSYSALLENHNHQSAMLEPYRRCVKLCSNEKRGETFAKTIFRDIPIERKIHMLHACHNIDTKTLLNLCRTTLMPRFRERKTLHREITFSQIYILWHLPQSAVLLRKPDRITLLVNTVVDTQTSRNSHKTKTWRLTRCLVLRTVDNLQ